MLPRQILPGTTYFITRRCAFRQFLLSPDPRINRIFRYCLAYAAEKTGILIHAFVVMSNHWHGILTDPEGRLPEFTEILHRLVAKNINSLLGRKENVWSMERYSAIPLHTLEDVVDKMAYVISNPTAAYLVRGPEDWPGLVTTIEQVGRHTQKVRRPETFFRPNGNMPEELDLEIVPPPKSEDVGTDGLREMVKAAVHSRCDDAARELRAAGGSFLGRKRIMRQKRTSSPTSCEPTRSRTPRFVSRDPEIRKRAMEAYRAFVTAYKIAWTKFKNGARDVIFPAGTYWLRRHMSVPCACPG